MLKNLFRTKNIDKIVSDAATEESHGGGLKRVLTLKDLTFFGIAAIIGAGSFSSLGEAIFKGGPGVIILFIICGIACAFTAMCYAEFASRIPVAGSAYTYAYASFGEMFAWIIGWALIMEYSIGNIYVAYSWSDYFTSFLSRLGVNLPDYLTSSYMEVKKAIADGTTKAHLVNAWNSAPNFLGTKFIVDLPAFVINILITALVYIGVKESKNFSNAMVVLKLAIVVLVILVGAQFIMTSNWVPVNKEGVKAFMPNGFSGVMSAVSAVFFAYIGFDVISVMGEEAKNPQRDLPRSMILSLVICTVIYILLTLVLTGGLHYSQYENVGDPLAKIFEANGNGWMQFIVSICAIIAITSVLLVFQLGQPRIWMSMSRDGLMPPKFQEIHPKYKTPKFATIMTGIVVGIPLLFTDRNFILDFTSIGTLFAFVLVCGGVLLLPKKEKVAGRFNMPYINAQYIFPGLLALTLTVITFSNNNYFTDLFQLKLNKVEKTSETDKFIKEKTNSISSQFYTTNDFNEIFKTKKLQKTEIGNSLFGQIETNEKVTKWVNENILYSVNNSTNILKLINDNSITDSTIFAKFDRNVFLKNVTDSINKIKKEFKFISDNQLAELTNTEFWDSAFLTKSRRQLQFNNSFKDTINRNSLEQNLFSKSINDDLSKVTINDLNNHFIEKGLVKKTFNISMIVFWLTCIVMAVFAFLRKWSLIPILGLVSCMYLLTGMAANNWKWFAIWFAIGLVIYALYGYRKSKLAK